MIQNLLWKKELSYFEWNPDCKLDGKATFFQPSSAAPCLFLQLAHQDERPHYRRQPPHTPVIMALGSGQKKLPLLWRSCGDGMGACRRFAQHCRLCSRPTASWGSEPYLLTYPTSNWSVSSTFNISSTCNWKSDVSSGWICIKFRAIFPPDAPVTFCCTRH